MSAARSIFATLLIAGLLAGCAAQAESPELTPVEPPTVTVYESAKTKHGYRLAPVEVRVPERVGGQPPFTSDAMRAVAALLDHTPTDPNRSSLWNGDCAPAERVTEVTFTGEEISVGLGNAGMTTCDVGEPALRARDQQLAWTILVNSKAELPRPPFPPVVVHDGPNTWEPIIADNEYLPPGDHY